MSPSLRKGLLKFAFLASAAVVLPGCSNLYPLNRFPEPIDTNATMRKPLPVEADVSDLYGPGANTTQSGGGGSHVIIVPNTQDPSYQQQQQDREWRRQQERLREQAFARECKDAGGIYNPGRKSCDNLPRRGR